MLKEIVKTIDISLSGRPKTTASDILIYGCKDRAYAPYGKYCRHVRKISIHELLSMKRVQQFQYGKEEEVKC